MTNDTRTRAYGIYYWETLEALETFAAHPQHLEAKRRYAEWHNGFHVVMAQVLNSYGNDQSEHVTSAEPAD